jgi:hypothetical protein
MCFMRNMRQYRLAAAERDGHWTTCGGKKHWWPRTPWPVGRASDGGAMAVIEAYHAGPVPPVCLSAVKSFFDGF